MMIAGRRLEHRVLLPLDILRLCACPARAGRERFAAVAEVCKARCEYSTEFLNFTATAACLDRAAQEHSDAPLRCALR